jgi:hypothetical protein
MRPPSVHRRQLPPWSAAVALAAALVGCSGADRGRPEAIDDGIPGPDVEDLGSGPFRCDQGQGLELGLIDDFEIGHAAGGGFYTNNDVCEICQALTDLRVGGYATGASLDRTARAVEDLLDDLEDEELREALRTEIERLIVKFGIWLEDPQFILHHAAAAKYKQQFEELLATDLGEQDVEAVRDLVNNPTNAVGVEDAPWGEIQIYIQAQMDSCRTTCEATQIPTPVFIKPVPATYMPDGRCGSYYAVNILAGPLTDWGGTLGTNFGPPLNGAEWDGISFWARVGTGSRTPVRVELSDKHTDEKYQDSDNDGRPICNPDKTEDTVRTGCDKFGINFQLTPDWKLYRVPFEEVRQKGWGMRAPYFDVGAIRGMSILFERGEWNLWVDDIALYRRQP